MKISIVRIEREKLSKPRQIITNYETSFIEGCVTQNIVDRQ
jgi:hypothetical protein